MWEDNGENAIQVLKGNNLYPKIQHSAKVSIRCKKSVKASSDIQGLRRFTSHVSFLRKLFEDVLRINEGVNHETGRDPGDSPWMAAVQYT